MYIDEQVRMRSMHACTPANKPAQGRCMRARQRTSQHEADACVHAGEQASMRPMHACTPANKPARGGCTRARRRTSQHEADACVHAGVQASMRPMHACTPANKPARSEEHTSELQSRGHLVCRLLIEKKKIYLILMS